ncbi:MAG TPA: hypothetical protein VMB05_10685 [Solirubrobacteraceae bacterium]|nr:hypothetical protein [Solirubrobacteraceae bacterium]
MDSELDRLSAQAGFVVELGQIRSYMEKAPEAYLRLSESDRDALERYYSLNRPMPDPDLYDEPVQVLVTWRDEAIAEDPDLAGRVELIRTGMYTPEIEFSYLTLRDRVVNYMLEHQDRFRGLRERELLTLDRYFRLGDATAITDPMMVLDHSKTVERTDAGIRRRVLKILAKVDGFEP